MKIKRLLVGSLTALTAGATLMLGAIGSPGLGDYVDAADGTMSSPMIVVGDAATPRDIIGATDIGVAIAGYATQTGTCTTTTTVGVSDAADLSTSSTKLYLGSVINRAKSTLTSSDLPDILASGTASVSLSGSYTYDQYITLGTTTTTFGTSNGDSAFDDPDVYVDVGTSQSSPIYNLTVTFNKALDLEDSNVRGGTLELFGIDYTIGTDSNSSATTSENQLVLLGGASVDTIEEGETATITVEGNEYTVNVLMVETATTATIDIDGDSRSVTEGSTYTFNADPGAIDVYVKDVLYSASGTTANKVKLQLGSSKITLEDGQNVQTGTSDTVVDGTYVFITGDNSGISAFTISVAAADSDLDHIKGGDSWTDSVFGSFKVAFNGLTPAIDSEDRDVITIDNSGTTKATLKFSDYRGNEQELTFAYTGSSWDPALNETSTRKYVILENQSAIKNDYILMSPTLRSDFSHIYRLGITSLGRSTGYFTLTDTMSGDAKTINFASPGYTNKTFYIDGQTYNVINASTAKLTFTWGSGASINSVGDKITLYPTIRAKGGEYVTLMKNVTFPGTLTVPYNFTADDANLTIELPTGDLNITFYVNATANFFKFNGGSAQLVNDTSAIATANITVGTFTYAVVVEHFTATTAAALTNIGPIQAVRSGTNNADGIGVFVVEELDNTSSTRGSIYVPINKDSTGYMTISAPIFQNTSSVSSSLITDSSITQYVTKPYGTLVEYDSDSYGIVTIKYPDDQAVATIAIGSDPTFSETTAGGEYEEVIKITSPVAKLATEVSTATLSADLILIGGPCANSIVADLMADDGVTCDNFNDNYSEGVIKEYTNAFDSGQKALVVAGWTETDTRNLAAMVMTGTTSYDE